MRRCWAPDLKLLHLDEAAAINVTALTPDLEAAILESVRRGTPPRQAALAVGISDRTLSRWVEVAQKSSDTWPNTDSIIDADTKSMIVSFVERLQRAQAECFEVLTNALYANATTVDPKTGRSDTQAADKLLSKHPTFRNHWYERKEMQVEHSGVINHELAKAESLDDEALMAAYQALELPPGAEA